MSTVSTPPAAHSLWGEETFYFTGGEYLERLIELTRSAKTSIRIESYIFELDAFGETLLEELGRAGERGVKVRLIIDAIGSPRWWREPFRTLPSHGVRIRVFGRPRDLVREAGRYLLRGKIARAFQTLRKFQLRDHRKLAIFDSEVALVGSANIGLDFSEWRETTVELRGQGVAELRHSFVRSWRFAARERLPDDERDPKFPQIRNNFTRPERRFVNRQFIARVRATERRLWMTTAYFHPRPKLLLALFFILKQGVDLRILVPRHSDISWFPWLSRTVFAGLIARGAKIYEFNGSMLHAKTTLFDRSALVGSRNMNYRSFMHDLELDVELESANAILKLEGQFAEDCRGAVELSRAQIRHFQPIAFLISLGLTPLKRWL
jgi:phosphatidylserine/phosphatidylglycerophosphate/cardiolipin synthase-like enzyme